MKQITSWRSVQSLADARSAIDQGVLLRWGEARHLCHAFSMADQHEVMRHFAERLVERAMLRSQVELLVESLLTWLAHAEAEELMKGFLGALLIQEGWSMGARTLVEIGLTSEVTESDHDKPLFALAVSAVCEMGLAIRERMHFFPAESAQAKPVLDYIATYLLSVSNSDNMVIRLSLMRYFGAVEQGTLYHKSLNRVMGRFGFTIMDHLFGVLFFLRKRNSESVALQYLLDNMPNFLEGDQHTQMLIHETFKQYMLKKPERFMLFITSLVDRMQDLPRDVYQISRKNIIQHMGALLTVASEVNHKVLGYELMRGIMRFESEPVREEVVRMVVESAEIRPHFRELLSGLHDKPENEKLLAAVAQIVPVKRGRKPCFAKSERLAPMHQAQLLGKEVVARVS